MFKPIKENAKHKLGGLYRTLCSKHLNTKGGEKLRYKITKQNLKDYEDERRADEREAQDIYCALCHSKANAIHEAKIIELVGKRGLEMLRQFHLIKATENCNYIL